MGLLPDLDLVGRLLGEWTSLIHHRGYSHSLILLPALVPLFGYLGHRWEGRRHSWPVWCHLVAWTLLTHPLLDLFTSYGTMVLAPLSWDRFAIDGVGIVDPIYSVALILGLALAHGARRRGGPGRRFTAGALILSSMYLLGGLGVTYVVKERARAQLEHMGFDPVRIRAVPPPVFTLVRRVVARDARGRVATAPTSLLLTGPMDFVVHDLPGDPRVDAVLESESGRTFLWFADGYVTASVLEGGVVLLMDQRYGMTHDRDWSPFQARFTVDGKGRVTSAHVEHGTGDLDVWSEIRACLALSTGRHASLPEPAP